MRIFNGRNKLFTGFTNKGEFHILNPKEERNDANRQPPFRDPCFPHGCDCPSPSVRAENMDPDGKPVWKRNKKMQVLEILSFVSSQ
jgi:hypothetical protein